MIELNVEPLGRYDTSKTGRASLDQFLHTDYVVVGTKGAPGSRYEDTKFHHVMAIQANDKDGCDNTGIHAATYITKDGNASPVQTPDVPYAYGLDVVNGDGGSSYPGCKHRGAWRHGMTKMSKHIASGYAVAGLTDNRNGRSASSHGTYFELEASAPGTTYQDMWNDKRGFCAGPRESSTNTSPRYRGQFQSVIALEKRPGVKFIQADTDNSKTFKAHEMVRNGRSSNRQGLTFRPPFKTDNFVLIGIANMHCSGGERLSFDDSAPQTKNGAYFRSVFYNGDAHTSGASCGFYTVMGVEAAQFL